MRTPSPSLAGQRRTRAPSFSLGAPLRTFLAHIFLVTASAHFVVTAPPSLSGTTVETATLRRYGPQGSILPSTSAIWLDSERYCSPSSADVMDKIVVTDRRNALCDDVYENLAAAGTYVPRALFAGLSSRLYVPPRNIHDFTPCMPRPSEPRRRCGGHHPPAVARGRNLGPRQDGVRLRRGSDARAADAPHGCASPMSPILPKRSRPPIYIKFY